MKKLIAALILLLVLVGCGSEKLVSESFKTDLDQVLSKLDNAYDENRRMEDSERDLFNKFYDKYIVGELYIDDEIYKMTDIEKEIVREVNSLTLFTEHDEPLASEKTPYEENKDRINELLKAKETPVLLVDKHPVYQKQDGINETFERDTKNIINKIDDMLKTQTIDKLVVGDIENYSTKYSGAGFEVDGVHYLHNDKTKDITSAITVISYQINEGSIKSYAEDQYIEVREKFLNN